MSIAIAFDNSYAQLPERFYKKLPPTPVSKPGLIKVNHALAADLGLDAAALESDEGVSMLAGNLLPDGADPLAQARRVLFQAVSESLVSEVDQRQQLALGDHFANFAPLFGVRVDAAGIVTAGVQQDDIAGGNGRQAL